MGLRIVLMGAPGAGKGTQAKLISEAHYVPHISTGDIFRFHIEHKTELGLLVEPYLRDGHLAPDELAVKVVAHRLGEPDCQQGYILDGFPRSKEQARQLEDLLATRGERIDVMLDIAVDDNEIIERLSARRMCPQCGAIYNLKFNPPAVEGQCNNAFCHGAALIHRKDDYADTVRERLRVYHETTEPILDYYQDSGRLISVKGTGSTPEQIFAMIESLIAKNGPASRP